jgi:hypothetical protein
MKKGSGRTRQGDDRGKREERRGEKEAVEKGGRR